jgi:hypothetical protein
MRRRLGPEAFRETRSTARGLGDGSWLWVCDEYELREDDSAEGKALSNLRLAPAYPVSREEKWRRYAPLKDYPDLFLKFARLHGRNRSPETALGWVREHGLLGCEAVTLLSRTAVEYVRLPETETIGTFFEEVDRAAAVLTLYEAVMNGDVEAARRVASEEFPSVCEGHREEYRSSGMGAECGGELGFALSVATHEVEGMVRKFCRLSFSIVPGIARTSKAQAGWGFETLLGAMYLQAYWLIAAGEAVAFCRYCGRPIPLALRQPDSRKTRRDKRFCNDACRQSHYYHAKRKRRRQDGPS